MRKIISIVLIVLLSIPYPALAQQKPFYISLDDEESDIFCQWTPEKLRLSAYYQMLNTSQYNPIVVTSAVGDPYYNSSNSWGQGYDDLWGLKKINAEQAWSISKGDDILVAVLDTGLDFTHTDINNNIWFNPKELNGSPGVDDDNNGFVDDIRGWDFVGADYHTPVESNNPVDNNGHGTFVSGIIAAEENNSGIIGVAPEAKIVPVKVMDNNGQGALEILAKGIKYAADIGAKIINMSLTIATAFMPSILREAIDYAYSLGCLLIVAAGNSSADVSGYIPANNNKVLTVSATDRNDAIASFSNYGNDVDVAAPGVGILSLRADDTDMYEGTLGYSPGANFVPSYNSGTQYYWANGTSMSTAYVSGLAALIYAENPSFSNDIVMNKIRFSSRDLGTAGFDRYFGYGAIDAYRALTTNFGTTFDMLDYYRAELNDISTEYKTPSGITTRSEVTGTKRIGSVDTKILKSFDTTEGAQYITLNSDGLRIYGISTDMDGNGTPDELIFDSPLDAMPRYVDQGRTYNDSTTFSWQYYSLTLHFQISSAVTIYGTEDVRLDSSIFVNNALKMATTLSIDNTDGYSIHSSQTSTSWIMKDLGDVKTIISVQGGGTDTYNIRTATNHYESGMVKSKLLQSPNPEFVYYEYLDENYNGTGTGRVKKAQRPNGTYDLYTAYWPASQTVRFKESYNANGDFRYKSEYDINGSLISISNDLGGDTNEGIGLMWGINDLQGYYNLMRNGGATSQLLSNSAYLSILKGIAGYTVTQAAVATPDIVESGNSTSEVKAASAALPSSEYIDKIDLESSIIQNKAEMSAKGIIVEGELSRPNGALPPVMREGSVK